MTGRKVYTYVDAVKLYFNTSVFSETHPLVSFVQLSFLIYLDARRLYPTQPHELLQLQQWKVAIPLGEQFQQDRALHSIVQTHEPSVLTHILCGEYIHMRVKHEYRCI